jgi:hypothetical protein
VLESAPGRIRVRLGAPPAGSGSGAFAWFGLRRRDTTLDIELRLERSNPLQQNQLLITVLMSSPDVKGPGTAAWREHCGKIYCDLRAHLAAASVTT